MEPMALGSPVGSPVQNPGSPITSAYLPSFLLGDTNTPAKVNVMSPNETRHLHHGHSNLTSPSSQYCTPDYRSNRQKAVFGNMNTPNTSQIVPESHISGPPTVGLFNSLETSPTMSSYALPASQSMKNAQSNQSRLLANSMNNSLFLESPLNMNPTEAQGLVQWVTVFGVPPNAINTILSHISSRVRIVDIHSAPQTQCNWIHLKCASEHEAQKALTCNGNIVSGSIMIGVLPCTDEGVILSGDKENHAKFNGSMRSFSNAARINQSPECNALCTPVRIQNARPLAAGYNQHLSPQSVRSPENVPQKSTGLVSKAMEYMFGW